MHPLDLETMVGSMTQFSSCDRGRQCSGIDTIFCVIVPGELSRRTDTPGYMRVHSVSETGLGSGNELSIISLGSSHCL